MGRDIGLFIQRYAIPYNDKTSQSDCYRCNSNRSISRNESCASSISYEFFNPFSRTTQSINQFNECSNSFCANSGSNSANSFFSSSSQSISQANECTASTCINTASNNVR